ncbi:TPA: hypothetical protein EYP70_05585 [Candidatus Bathyarchaeota archaeon]|nr:hypothetical protein [Candidatus Bathyarchaeota archaeon]
MDLPVIDKSIISPTEKIIAVFDSEEDGCIVKAVKEYLRDLLISPHVIRGVAKSYKRTKILS